MSDQRIWRGSQTGRTWLANTMAPVTLMAGMLTLAVLLSFGIGKMIDRPQLAPQSSRPGSALEASDAVYRGTMPRKELQQLREATDTPAEREQVNEVLATAFEDVGEVKIAGPQADSAGGAPGGGPVQQVLAYGATGTHVWVTASYADMAAGAIWGAVRFCQRVYPPLGGVCTYVGNLLTSWARGWGAASNHGVWGALYYWGQVTGGRW